MKRTYLIIGGIAILVILVGLWAYLLFFGTPKEPGEVFSNFGFGPGDEPLPAENVDGFENGEQPIVDVNQEPLRQLTTRPVAGFMDVQVSSTSPHYVYYGEAGTGHVYRINLLTGAEERISNTTIPSANDMHISDSAHYLVARSGFSNSNDVVFTELSGRSATSTQLQVLPGTLTELALRGESELLYITPGEGGAIGKSLDLTTLAERTLFTIPFGEATMIWGDTGSDVHYVYPKPSYQVEGYLYELRGGELRRLPVAGRGLTAEGTAGTIAYATYAAEDYTTAVHLENGETVRPAVNFLPEKCDFVPGESSRLWCAVPQSVSFKRYPDSWYQGVQTGTDGLWETDLESLQSTFHRDILTASGREVDVTGLHVSGLRDSLFFINKRDNTLWAYDY